MNDELKKKLIEFDIKTDELWDLMEQIQQDFPELPGLIKSFNTIKNAMMTIPSSVYGISSRENVDEQPLLNKLNNCVDTTSTHIYTNGKWYLASELPKE